MIQITNVRSGEVVNHHYGVETADYLEIPIEGIASSPSVVKVNGMVADRCDRQFTARVRLTQKVNTVCVTAEDTFGEYSQTITLVWDKNSFKRYNFFFDDCSFFLRWIALHKPASLFEEMFLGRLKAIHEKYGSKFMLNLFYHDDHHDFSISDFPADYKEEFQANKEWLRLSFHSKQEFPDRPYQHASAEKLAMDYDQVYNEVCRFAGAECFIPPMVIHWAITNPANFPVLKERGTKCLSGGFMNCRVSIDEKTPSFPVTDIGYHYEQDVTRFIVAKNLWYDKRFDMFLLNKLLCCNYNDQDVVKRLFANLRQNRDTISLMSHEQYSYSDYFNYIPDHLDRVELACRLATEHGYKPVWFPEGILGNTSWDQ